MRVWEHEDPSEAIAVAVRDVRSDQAAMFAQLGLQVHLCGDLNL